MMQKATALVMEEFGKPFVLTEFPLPDPGDGEVLVKIDAAGICGSDIHIHEGHDPRTPVPIILGHEGVGTVEAIGSGAKLSNGEKVQTGMPVVWERSLTCGICYFCKRHQEYLCTERKVYGIHTSCKEPPHLSGNYATHLLLRKGTSIFPRNPDFDPAVLVPATCSGTTASHAHELADIKTGDTVVVFGSGPIALFQIAFALDAGAKWVTIITRKPGPKAGMAKAFGADEVILRTDLDHESITDKLMSKTNGIGVDVVLDTTPDPKIFKDSVGILRRGGSYVNPGIAVPVDAIQVQFYEEVVNKNLTIKGAWASHAGHLENSIQLVQSGRYPFEEMVTHRFPLELHEDAWKVLIEKDGVKVVFEP